jgi:hypothetical protein
LTDPGPEAPERKSARKRLAWFVLLYAAGLGTVAAVAFVIRLWLA